jgi:hypothetical protein
MEKKMGTSIQSSFKTLVQEIFNLPVWIKQVVYVELKEQLENSTINSCINTIPKRELLQLYVPKLTYTGKKELENKTKNYSENIYAFLECAFQNLSIMETAINNKWNLHECSKYFLEAINTELVIHPPSSIVKGTALYMSGEIRIGEYFVKIGKISLGQLDEGLRTQKKMEESFGGDRPGLAEILVNLGFLNHNETEGILLLKEDCLKHYKTAQNPLNETRIIS